METFGANLRQRAEQLGLSNAEVARRVGLSERRYGNYVTGRRQPDFALLVRIAEVLQTTPDELLGVERSRKGRTKRTLLMERLAAAADAMTDADLEAAVAQAQAVAALRRR
jgi:transcriptional regulator with XRE-family HTH domain